VARTPKSKKRRRSQREENGIKIGTSSRGRRLNAKVSVLKVSKSDISTINKNKRKLENGSLKKKARKSNRNGAKMETNLWAGKIPMWKRVIKLTHEIT